MQNIGKNFCRILTIVVLLSGAKYLWSRSADLQRIMEVPIGYILTIACLYVLFFNINGQIFRLAVARFNIILSSREAMGISFISSFLNYVVPLRGGLGFKFLFMKAKHQLSISHNLGIFALISLMALLVNSFWGIIFYTSLWKLGKVSNDFIFFILAIVFFLCLFIIFSVRIIVLPNNLPGRIREFQRNLGESLRSTDWKFLAKLFTYFNIQIVLSATIMWFELYSIGVRADFLACVILCIFSTLSMVINLTPGNIGIKELAIVLISDAFGIRRMDILNALIIDRLLSFGLLLITSGYFYWAMLRLR